MNALDILRERGFVQQCTDADALAAAMAEGPVTFYVGFDPTADSLHVGHLLPVMAMSWMQRAGHVPIAIVGGGTAMVGDPSGKTEMRQLLSEDDIGHNLQCLKRQLERFLVLDGERGHIVNNADWLMGLSYIAFLREIGRHFSVNRMLAMEAYKQRLERGLSFIEFNYQLLQAYDFLELHRRYSCTLQMGGDDQWGNILAGTDLVRRMTGARTHGLTQPLILTSAGQKMGKTAMGAVWLDPQRMSPFAYYQYWLNVDDGDVIRFLKLYTHLPMDQIAELGKLEGADTRRAKRTLAYESTKLVHGEAQADKAAADDMPVLAVQSGVKVYAALQAAGFAKSNGEGRRLIKGGGVRLDGEKLVDWEQNLNESDLIKEAVLRVGKKRAVRLVRA